MSSPTTQNDAFAAQVGFRLHSDQSVLANDTDPDGDALTVTAVAGLNGSGRIGDATQGRYGTLYMNADGSYDYLGTGEGTDTFTYTASDGRGGMATADLSVDVRAIRFVVPSFAVVSEAGEYPKSIQLSATGGGSFAVGYADGVDDMFGMYNAGTSYVARTYDVSGHAVGSFTVNAENGFPAYMAGFDTGGFAALFPHYGASFFSDDSYWQFQGFTSTGPIGMPVPLADTGSRTNTGSLAAIAALDGDRIVVAKAGVGADVGKMDFQVLSRSGGVEARSLFTDVRAESIAPFAGGGFVTVWTAYTNDGNQIRAQRFTAGGALAGASFNVNAAGTSAGKPDVTSLTTGGFAVAWSDGEGIKGQVFSAAGDPVGSQLAIARTGGSSQPLPTLAGLADGRFVIAWTGDPTDDLGRSDALARVYDARGNALGQTFDVYEDVGTYAEIQAVGLGGDTFGLAWQDPDLNDVQDTHAIRAAVLQYVAPSTGSAAIDSLSVAGDDVINAAEAGRATVPVIGTLSAPLGDGQTVQVRSGSQTVLARVTGTSLAADLPTPGASGTVTATVVTSGGEAIARRDQAFTIDAQAPMLVSAQPGDDASGVARGATVVLTFSEPVLRGAGAIDLRRSSDGAVVASSIAVSGTTVTVDPVSDLDPSTAYDVTIAADALLDAAGNAYAGIGDASVLNFATSGPETGTPDGGGGTGGSSAATQALFGAVTHDVTSPAGTIDGLYEAILGRAPDPLGLEGYVAQLQAGRTAGAIAGEMLASPEFAARFGAAAQTDDQFLDTLYRNAFGRAPDEGGRAGYDDRLAHGAARADVAAEIASSAESHAARADTFAAGLFVPDVADSQVARLYYGLLDRAPDASGLGDWEQAYRAGRSLESIAQGFLDSPEGRAASGDQSNEAFVTGLYAGALGRAPDEGGLQGYADLLAGGTSRAAVAVSIAESPEAQLHLAPVIEAGLRVL